ncbi:MAG: hypothetical protein AAF970_02640 [Bacteroidota bacterium]
MNRLFLLLCGVLCLALVVAGCDDLLGSKDDPTTEEIFDEGRIDPSLVDEVGYVPLIPFFENGFQGGLQAPTDVYVGYDEFIYVTDDAGLHVLDLAGRPQTLIPLDEAVAVIQDRRLQVYVAARRDTVVNNQTWNLPVIYRYSNVSTGQPTLENIIWHPFDDDSRKLNRPDPVATDEEVAFTGVAVLGDNRIRVSRRGPVNIQNSAILQHNAIMEFSPEGVNTQTFTILSPTRPSLRSSINPSDIVSFFQPPQRRGLTQDLNFIIAQSPPPGDPLQYAVLSIVSFETTNGISYRPDTQRLVPAIENDTTKGNGFLYDSFKFENPSDLALAGDETGYLYVLDSAKDSLFVFTSTGIEGVAPPPGASSTRPVIVSFGGAGDGPLQVSNPQGVAYYDRIVYVADTGNNRISRYRLNTDFE